jgi:PKHD-type hydroxylase
MNFSFLPYQYNQNKKFDPCSILKFPNSFSESECQTITDYAQKQSIQSIQQDSDYSKVRDVDVVWLDNSENTIWIYKRIAAIVQKANDFFHYELSGMYESLQFTIYKPGSFFDYHVDIGRAAKSIRKLTVVIQLSSPEEYKGGELILKNLSAWSEITASKERGTAVVFPSFIPHKVTELTEGNRLSLVSWIGGHPFR